MSKTPRTDQAAFEANFSGTVFKVVDAYFARQLETELATAKAKLRELRKKINKKKKMLAEKLEFANLIEFIDKRCAAVNKKLIEMIKEEDLLTTNKLIKEKYDLLTAKRVLSGISKELGAKK